MAPSKLPSRPRGRWAGPRSVEPVIAVNLIKVKINQWLPTVVAVTNEQIIILLFFIAEMIIVQEQLLIKNFWPYYTKKI